MRRLAAAFVGGLMLVGCGQASPPSAPAPSQTTHPVATATPAATSTAAPTATAAALGLGAFPSPPTGELSADLAASLQAILEQAVDEARAPGIAAALTWAGHGTWAGAAGTTDGEAPLDPAAQFGIGSVTKTVIAAQVLKLVESGAVQLDRPIAEYVGTDVPTNGATVRQVLGMRSGIGEATGDVISICADLAKTFSLDEIKAVLPDRPVFEAGSQFRYTNANYDLAGILIEEVTGTTVGTALRSGVLSAPGLERLVYQDEERPTAPLAAPFVVLEGGEPVPGPNELLQLGDGYLPARCLAATAGPAGGMASDAMSLARWGYLLYGGSVLGEEQLAAMTAFESGYGLAAHDHADRFGVPAVGHEGTVPGYVSQLLAFPDEGLSVAVLANTNGSEEDMTMIAGRIRDALSP